MSGYIGDFLVGGFVSDCFGTYAASGAPVAPSTGFEAADIQIYKDSSTTPRSSANGVTMTSPLNSVVGLHRVTIDTSDNTDAGFYAAGHTYSVVLNADELVDGVAAMKPIFSFSIQHRVVATAVALGAGSVNTTSVADGTITDAKIAADAITAAKIADGAIDPATFTASALEAIADNVLARDYAATDLAVSVSTHSLLMATRWLRNDWDIVGGILTVLKENGVTTAFTKQNVTQTAGNPVTAMTDV